MLSTGLPDGAYFSVIGNVRLEAGGQTRLALLRHRLFTLHAGVSLPILTYNPVPSYEPIRSALVAEGQLLPASELRNLHEELRAWPTVDVGTPLEPLDDTGSVDADLDGEYRWRERRRVGSSTEVWDYLRPDRSRYLRTPPTDVDGPVHLCGLDGHPVLTWPGLGELWRWWTMQIAPAEGSVFLISDSRFIATELGQIDDPRVFLMHQMHNPHLTGERRWNSPVSASYRTEMSRIGDLDGLLSLTERQRDDIAQRYGATSNLFVVPNPVEPPTEPAVLPARRPHAIAMIARLDEQKRIDRAIEAFSRVRRDLSSATLDIYGDGPLREPLQAQIDATGLSDAITLHGHDPRARDALWTASVFWLTSQFEGYPLSTLEAMSHGCPVVSMDMPYGPREQITDGTDGLLIGFGNVEEMAERTVGLLGDEDQLAAMSTTARATAASHGHARFLADWRSVLLSVTSHRPSRRELTEATWRLDTSAKRGRVRWSGTLTIDTPTPEHLDEVQVVAQAWSPDHVDLVELPMTVQRSGSTFTVAGSLGRTELAQLVPGASHVELRIGYLWRQLAGFTPLTERPLPVRRRWFS